MNQITPGARAQRPFISSLSACFLCLYLVNANAQEEPDDDAGETSKAVVLMLDYRSNACAARISIEYFQRGANARVKSSLSNKNCGASSGEYTIQVRIRDAESQLRKLDFPVAWSRDDFVTLESTTDYFIGDNVDLVRVNSRNLTCRCAEVATDDDSEPEDN